MAVSCEVAKAVAVKRGLDVEPSSQLKESMKRQALEYIAPPHVAAYVTAGPTGTFETELSTLSTRATYAHSYYHSPDGQMSPFPTDAFNAAFAPTEEDLTAQREFQRVFD